MFIPKVKVAIEEAYKDIKELRDVAKQCKKEITEAQKLKALIEENWQGDSATAMQSTLDDWIKEQQSIVNMMEQNADIIEKYVKQMQSADKSLANLFGGFL